jgi:hypothetical protein
MSERLSDVLIDLASDPMRLARFAANPEGVLAHLQLSGEERAALIAGDAEGLRTALAAASDAGGGIKIADTERKKKGGGNGGGGGVKKAKKKKKRKGGGGGVKKAKKR